MGLVPAAQVMGLPSIVGAHTQDEVQLALDRASAAVESYCERKFALVESDTITVDPYFSHVKAMPAIPPMTAYASYPGYGVAFSALGSPYIGTALLPDPPVSDVSMIEAYMPLAMDGSSGWLQLINFGWATDGFVWDTSGMPGVAMADGGPAPSWPRMPRSLRITYTHGYVLPGTEGAGPSLPDGVVTAVVGMAAFYLDNPGGVMENRVGEITQRYELSKVAGWLDEKLLGEFRLVHL